MIAGKQIPCFLCQHHLAVPSRTKAGKPHTAPQHEGLPRIKVKESKDYRVKGSAAMNNNKGPSKRGASLKKRDRGNIMQISLQ